MVLRDLVWVFCLRKIEYCLGGYSLQYVSTNRKVMGTDTDGKEVTRLWVDLDPVAIEVLKKHLSAYRNDLEYNPDSPGNERRLRIPVKWERNVK